MAAKKSKAIKQLEKQIKKLNARIDDMSREIKGLQDAVNTTVITQTAAESEEEFTQETWPKPRFTEDEVESAEEMTENAEEAEDILEKADR